MDSLPSSACLLPLLIHTEANRTVLVGCTPGKSEYQCLKSNGIRDACSTADIIDCHSLPVLKTNTQTFEDCEMSKLTPFAPSVWGFSFPIGPTKITTASGGCCHSYKCNIFSSQLWLARKLLQIIQIHIFESRAWRNVETSTLK